MSIRVTIEDLETGDVESRVVADDALVIVEGSAHVANVQTYATGTQVWTIKGIRTRAGGAS